MEQTNSASSLRLQPNKSNNIGNIVQEYIRYNRKYEDEKTAREKIEKAREAEFQFKLDGRTDKLLESLRPDDTVGYFNSQVAEAFTEQQDYLRDLAQRKANGDLQASIQYDKELTKWRNLSQAGKAFKDKIASNSELRKKNGFNPILDESYLNLEKSLLNGGLVLDRKTLETKIVSADGTDVILPASKITSNEFFTHQFNPLAKFQGNNEYGNAIVQSVYGENPNISDEEARLKGVNAVRNIFATDPNELNSWYGTYLKRQGKNPRGQDPYSELDLKTKQDIQQSYLNEFAPKPVKTIKEQTEEERLKGVKLDNTSKRFDNREKDRKEKIAKELIKNPPLPEDKSTEAEKKRNYTRTLVDGIKAGDLSSIQTLVDLQASSSKKGFISDVDYSNGILEYKFTKKEDDEDVSEILKIDTSKPDAPARILALLYPTSDPANSMYNYKFGKPLETFKINDKKGISKFTEQDIRDNIVIDNETKTVKNLKKLGIELKESNAGTDAVEYKGVEYVLESEEDKERFVNKIIQDKNSSQKDTSTNNASRFNKK